MIVFTWEMGSPHYEAIKSQTGCRGGRLPPPLQRGPLVEYKMFPTSPGHSLIRWDLPLLQLTVTEPSFIIPQPPNHHPYPTPLSVPSLCKSSSTVFGSQISPTPPPHPQHYRPRFLSENTLLLSERYYLFYLISEVNCFMNLFAIFPLASGSQRATFTHLYDVFNITRQAHSTALCLWIWFEKKTFQFLWHFTVKVSTFCANSSVKSVKNTLYFTL